VLRQRLLFSPYSTAELLAKPELTELKITADLSHWCCVCEKVFDPADTRDDWWPATLALVARHCEFVHARVRHAEGPQVSEPDAPEFAAEVAAHTSWWRAIWAAQAARHTADGATVWAEPEHGPPPYLQTAPYTLEPAAELWGVNTRMAARVRREHAAAVADLAAAAAAVVLPAPAPLDFFAGDACLDGTPFAGVKWGYIFRTGDAGLGYYRDAFVAAPAFDQARPGFAFRPGELGTGYYRDGSVDPKPKGAPPTRVGKDGSLIRAAMSENPDVAARLGPMMGGGSAARVNPEPAPPASVPQGGLLSAGMEAVRLEEEAAAAAVEERELCIRLATAEGVTVGAQVAAAHAETNVEFVCTSVEAAKGDIALVQLALAAMNRAAGDAAPGGGSAHVAKMVFSAGEDQLALVAYVPAETALQVNRSTGHTHTPTENNTPDNDTHARTRRKQHPKRTPPTALQVDAAAWAQAVLAEIGGKVMCSKPLPAQSPKGGLMVCAAVAADAEADHVPRRVLEIGLVASASFLEAEGKK